VVSTVTKLIGGLDHTAYCRRMNTNSPHTSSHTINESTHARSNRRGRHAGSVRPAPVHGRARIGRFDDGMATDPVQSRARIGRFDDGMATDPVQSRARIGRFDDGMATDPAQSRARIGWGEDEIAEQSLAA
jgi:hypothetical protein